MRVGARQVADADDAVGPRLDDEREMTDEWTAVRIDGDPVASGYARISASDRSRSVFSKRCGRYACRIVP